MTARFAVVGNPNVGKTTLFNALTGLSQVTGNYPGVTVERKSGSLKLNGAAAELVDLPGTYSLAAHSPDEMIVVDVLLNQQAGERAIDAILAVVDATNLERNLYLVSQLRDLGKPLVVALNMMDIADERGIRIDAARLSEDVGIPFVPVCASKRRGMDALKEALTQAAHSETSGSNGQGPDYPRELLDEVEGLAATLNTHAEGLGRDVPHLEAFRILVDRGGYAEQRITALLPDSFTEELAERRDRVAPNGSLAALETRSRYGWIREVVAKGLQKPETFQATRSDKIDEVLTHKVFGTVLFAVLMLLVFQAIYSWAAPFMDVIDGAFTQLGDVAAAAMPSGALQSLVRDGVINGVGSVLVFLPQIFILSLFIAILEDCGYMARAAFLMDKLLSRCGLSGQSFIPLLSSFACAIPGIMATRTIANRRDRLTTMLVAPLMSCSARLPVYIIMIETFIPEQRILGGALNVQGATLFAMYAVGLAVAIPVAWILKRTLLKGDTPPFLLELPSYKVPQWRTVLRKAWGQGMHFLRRAGTVIFAISVIVWALAYFPRSDEITATYDAVRADAQATVADEAALEEALGLIDQQENSAQLENSIFGRMGHAVEPVVKPLGWDWRIGMAAIASFPAREVIIATLGTIFSMGDEVDESSEPLREVLRGATWQDSRPLFSIPVALSIMVFFALCCQCGATLAVMKRETGTWRWPVFTFAYMTGLAYVAAFAVYQGATLIGLGGA
jgi:ferrous iron transport protein B